MEQKIEAPNDEDVDRIARQLIYAQSIIEELSGSVTTGGTDDPKLIQKVIDSGSLQPDATSALQAIGMAFGKIFVNENEGYDWWMVEDEYGRDPSIRYKETTLLVFPQTMISKRIEDGEEVDVHDLYYGLIEQLTEIREQNPDYA
jgi:hypothetical protein